MLHAFYTSPLYLSLTSNFRNHLCGQLTIQRPSTALAAAADAPPVDAEVRGPHVLGEVLAVLRPLAPGHVQVGRPAARAERLRHVRLHGPAEADRSPTVVRVDVRVLTQRLAAPLMLLLSRLMLLRLHLMARRVAVEVERRGEVTGALGGEPAGLGVEDLGDVGGQGEPRGRRVVARHARVQLLGPG